MNKPPIRPVAFPALAVVLNELDLTHPEIIVGRHSAWVPPAVYAALLRAEGLPVPTVDLGEPGAAPREIIGLKLPFQLDGRIVKYTHPHEAKYDVFPGLSNEYAMLQALADQGAAPPVNRPVFVRTLTSTPGGKGDPYADPRGAHAYEMVDAEALPRGDFRGVQWMVDTLPISGSVGAWGDVTKPGNIVNGYLIDVRRSGHDLLRWDGPAPWGWPAVPPTRALLGALEDRVRRECQYPPGIRPEPYQDFYLMDRWISGSRRVEARARAMGFDPGPGESVLDVGCQSGGFLQWAALQQSAYGVGACGILAGIDVIPEYIACAEALRVAARQPIQYKQADVVADFLGTVKWIKTTYPAGVDHLLLLSMEKHIGDALWLLIDEVNPGVAYVETNAYAEGRGDKAGVEARILARGGTYVGDSNDRNPRRMYRIPRNTGTRRSA